MQLSVFRLDLRVHESLKCMRIFTDLLQLGQWGLQQHKCGSQESTLQSWLQEFRYEESQLLLFSLRVVSAVLHY